MSVNYVVHNKEPVLHEGPIPLMLSPFWKMWYDLKEKDDTIQNLNLNSLEYRYHYSLTNFNISDRRRESLISVTNSTNLDFVQSNPSWAESYQSWRGDYSKFSEAEYTEFKKKATDLYDKNFPVELLNPDDPPHLIESLQVTQRDITKGILFRGISYTLGQPCVTDFYPVAGPGFAYYDLVGDYCNRFNNEICAPRSLSQFEDPDNQMKGWMSVLKPKWVFSDAKDRTPDGKCFGYKTWVIQQQTCRCGFRTDCGKDLGVSINCPLQPNDWEVRRQCRGSVGYPCKTLPMAPGKHHESCVTGYCDMEGNSCEDGPTYKQSTGRVVPVFGIVTFTYVINSMFQLAIGILYY
ncbi:unnamed protein product [Orchesella dallaii]|uniref:Uncharacterized protein n=1 Tax=Orchesella dallaii TaxID=48710 RepID=A0ABP1Q368_9HEXA